MLQEGCSKAAKYISCSPRFCIILKFYDLCDKAAKMLQEVCKYTVGKKMGLYFLKDENLVCIPVEKIRDHSACHSSCRVIKE